VAVVGKAEEQCLTIFITTCHPVSVGALRMAGHWVSNLSRGTYKRLELCRFERHVLLRVNHGVEYLIEQHLEKNGISKSRGGGDVLSGRRGCSQLFRVSEISFVCVALPKQKRG
jgi:hypothetical protein